MSDPLQDEMRNIIDMGGLEPATEALLLWAIEAQNTGLFPSDEDLKRTCEALRAGGSVKFATLKKDLDTGDDS